MLRRDVIDAVREGRFHIYAAQHVDQVMALLCGREAGLAVANGLFPEHSINGTIQRHLRELAPLDQHQGSGDRQSV